MKVYHTSRKQDCLNGIAWLACICAMYALAGWVA